MAEVSRAEVASFYDEFSTRQQRDFVFGNARVSAAIERVQDVLTPDINTLLDVGCGCGQFAWEFACKFPHLQVVGLDISPRNIQVAQTLFQLPNLRYDVSDLSSAPEGKFDLITLIDVYEHIPKNDRTAFHQNIASCISDSGSFVVTTPSPMYQKFLAEECPEELQVIDEIVELADLVLFAETLGATPRLYELMAIWKQFDYIHFVASRNSDKITKKRSSPRSRSLWSKISSRVETSIEVSRRKKLVREKLGIEVTRATS